MGSLHVGCPKACTIFPIWTCFPCAQNPTAQPSNLVLRLLTHRLQQVDPCEHFQLSVLAQDLPRLLTQWLIDVNNIATCKAPEANYPTVGLPDVALFKLHSDLLSKTAEALNTPEDLKYFGEHAYECNRSWFVSRVGELQGVGTDMDYFDPLPYLSMFGEHAESFVLPCIGPSAQACITVGAAFLRPKNCLSCHRHYELSMKNLRADVDPGSSSQQVLWL